METSKVDTSSDGLYVTVTVGGDHTIRHNAKWLRFHCQCNTCKQPFSGIMTLDRASFNLEMQVKSAAMLDDKLHCDLEGHGIEIPVDYLVKTCGCNTCLEKEMERKKPSPMYPKSSIVTIDHGELSTDEGMYKCVENIIIHGYCVVKHSTFKSREEFEEFAKRFGCLRSTYCGDSWDVGNKQDEVNFEYTGEKLNHQQDLPSYEVEPGVQFLSVIDSDDTLIGGDAKLVDLIECAEILRARHPEQFEALCRVPFTFGFRRLKVPAMYEHTKTLIDLDYFGKVVSVHWSPQMERQIRAKSDDMEKIFTAHKAFRNIIDEAELQTTFRLKAGDLIIFNNRRLGRGREPCGGNGKHLRGCYVNIDDLRSKYKVLANKLGRDVTPPRLCNRSSF